MAMLSRAYAAFAAAFRSARKSDQGVTGVEYGVMFAIFGAGMLAAVGFLITGATANYDASESQIAAAPIVCEADEFFDSVQASVSRRSSAPPPPNGPTRRPTPVRRRSPAPLSSTPTPPGTPASSTARPALPRA